MSKHSQPPPDEESFFDPDQSQPSAISLAKVGAILLTIAILFIALAIFWLTSATPSAEQRQELERSETGAPPADTPEIQLDQLVVGEGSLPETGQTIRVHYIGRFEDGTEFDSSYKRGQPFEFQYGLGQVIQGWDIAFGRLTEGSKAIITIPPELAYGSRGAGSTIPPNTTLIFEVELVEIVR